MGRTLHRRCSVRPEVSGFAISRGSPGPSSGTKPRVQPRVEAGLVFMIREVMGRAMGHVEGVAKPVITASVSIVYTLRGKRPCYRSAPRVFFVIDPPS